MKPDVNPQYQQSRPKGPRAARKVSQERLKRQALYYLERYNATQASLTQVLKRKVARAASEQPDTDLDQAHGWIEAIVARCVDLGLVNDASFALGRARSLLRSGKSLRAIKMVLRQKGIDQDLIDTALERLKDERDTRGSLTGNRDDPNLMRGHSGANGSKDDGLLEGDAARTYARKRRLGGYRFPPDPDRYDRDLAALARQGFSYDVAKRVLDASLAGLDNDTQAP